MMMHMIHMVQDKWITLNTIIHNSRDRQGLYGFQTLKNNGTIAIPSNTSHIQWRSQTWAY